jgi:hypothetical protein
MPAPQVRPFRRADRDQLTDLVNTHVAAVVPGVSVSVNTVLSDLERRPEEFLTDPWVSERVTLVAERRDHIVAAARLLRYRADDEVGPHYRDVGEIGWFVGRVPASFLPDTEEAADLLMSACLAQLARWGVRARYADGRLPAPAVYGVPRAWPHVRAVYERAGFRRGRHRGRPHRPRRRPAAPGAEAGHHGRPHTGRVRHPPHGPQRRSGARLRRGGHGPVPP